MQKFNVEKSNEFDLNNKFVSVGMFVPYLAFFYNDSIVKLYGHKWQMFDCQLTTTKYYVFCVLTLRLSGNKIARMFSVGKTNE